MKRKCRYCTKYRDITWNVTFIALKDILDNRLVSNVQIHIGKFNISHYVIAKLKVMLDLENCPSCAA